MSTNKVALKPNNSLIDPLVYLGTYSVFLLSMHIVPKVATFLAFLRALVTAKLVPVLLSFL